jgi:hypothetical protein
MLKFRKLIDPLVLSVLLTLSLSSGCLALNIEQKTYEIAPKLEVLLPNGIVDLFLNERISRTLVDFKMKYDFFGNHIGGALDMRYYYPTLFIGMNLMDRLDFEDIFSNRNCIQRSRHVLLYYGWNLSDYVEFKASVKSESTFTIAVDNSSSILDKGHNIPGILTLQYNSLNETEIIPSGAKASLDLTGSLGIAGSDYDYSMLEFGYLKYFYPFGNNYLKINLKTGYPVSLVKKPWSTIYSIGGYEMLRGYDLGEFKGDSFVYSEISYHIPLVKTIGRGSNSLEIITGDLICEFAKTGGTDVYYRFDDLKGSVGLGFSCTMVFLKNINTKFNIFLNKALEPRKGIMYFTLKAFNYVLER